MAQQDVTPKSTPLSVEAWRAKRKPMQNVSWEHDLQINIKAEEEIQVILMHLEQQQALLTELVKAQGIKQDAVMGEKPGT